MDSEETEEQNERGELRISNEEVDKTVTLYACATMWHETRNEMMQMIKSIMRFTQRFWTPYFLCKHFTIKKFYFT